MAQSVDYDAIAGDYDARYARNDYTGIQRALAVFLATERGAESRHVLEVGCGTGHWVHVFGSAETKIVGLDVSEGMLAIARTRQSGAGLIRARAEALPCATASVDRIFCVNALHHFSDRAAFFRESRRVLARGGGLLTIGLDPHAGRDQWWIYDYFPSALAVDRQRYPPVGSIRKLMEDSGLSQCETREVQHLAMRMTVSEAERRGYLDRASTSQLMVISQAEYESGNGTNPQREPHEQRRDGPARRPAGIWHNGLDRLGASRVSRRRQRCFSLRATGFNVATHPASWSSPKRPP